MRVIIDPAFLVYRLVELYPLGSEWQLFSNIRVLEFLGVDYIHMSAIGIIADAWVCFRFIGIIVYPFCLSLFLTWINSKFIHRSMLKACGLILCFIYSILLIYSNMFSLMPIFGFFVIYFIIIYPSTGAIVVKKGKR